MSVSQGERVGVCGDYEQISLNIGPAIRGKLKEESRRLDFERQRFWYENYNVMFGTV